MNPPRIVRESGGFVARSDDYPELIGRGPTEEAAKADFEEKLLKAEVRDLQSNYENWDGRSDDERRDGD